MLEESQTTKQPNRQIDQTQDPESFRQIVGDFRREEMVLISADIVRVDNQTEYLIEDERAHPIGHHADPSAHPFPLRIVAIGIFEWDQISNARAEATKSPEEQTKRKQRSHERCQEDPCGISDSP